VQLVFGSLFILPKNSIKICTKLGNSTKN